MHVFIPFLCRKRARAGLWRATCERAQVPEGAGQGSGVGIVVADHVERARAFSGGSWHRGTQVTAPIACRMWQAPRLGAKLTAPRAMVVKTELCNFSGFRIYPGHGRRYIRGDSKPFWFISGKSHADFQMKRNPRKLDWTQVYRRLHKKGTLEEVQKRRVRRTVKVQRAIEGADLAAIKAKRNQKPEARQAARESALREVKEQKRKAQAAKQTTREKAPKAKAAQSKPAKMGKSSKR